LDSSGIIVVPNEITFANGASDVKDAWTSGSLDDDIITGSSTYDLKLSRRLGSFNKLFSGDQPRQMNKRNRRFEVFIVRDLTRLIAQEDFIELFT
jgi:hypothetical protein